ncbi:MAG: hypothetical protein JW739_07935 [Opitutales bacterium]|nr:hypothetical protein [Opitutales bacterium]
MKHPSTTFIKGLCRLGESVSYGTRYDKSLLFAIPRSENRARYAINEGALPFIGQDSWHAYESGFITESGLPVAGLLKIVIPADSPYLVESKSLKLYLNSFNMEPLGASRSEAISRYVSIIQQDLSALLESDVQAAFHEKEEFLSGGFDHYPVLEDQSFAALLDFVHFKETPELLKKESISSPAFWCCHLLRSNCKVTHQPDWGTAYIYVEGDTGITPQSLLRYLVSFREEFHFHEEVCEMIYKRIYDLITPPKLSVTCIYTRRGGIDICPQRCSHSDLISPPLAHPQQLAKRLLRQ